MDLVASVLANRGNGGTDAPPVLGYATLPSPGPPINVKRVRTVQVVLTVAAVVMAALVLWRMYTLTEAYIAACGSSCGTCRRGPRDARDMLLLWALPAGFCYLFTGSWPAMHRVCRLAFLAVVLSGVASRVFH